MAKGQQEKDPDIATKIMAVMVRMPPKPHEEMKLGKSKGKAGSKASRKSKPEK
jgi:hypothetical protein